MFILDKHSDSDCLKEEQRCKPGWLVIDEEKETMTNHYACNDVDTNDHTFASSQNATNNDKQKGHGEGGWEHEPNKQRWSMCYSHVHAKDVGKIRQKLCLCGNNKCQESGWEQNQKAIMVWYEHKQNKSAVMVHAQQPCTNQRRSC